MPRTWRQNAIVGLGALLWLSGCGGDDSGPSPAPPLVAKTSSKSGDAQIGQVFQALASPLRVVVTQDGKPLENTTVEWSTTDGTLSPASVPTDADGLSTATWTLGGTEGQQTATASV